MPVRQTKEARVEQILESVEILIPHSQGPVVKILSLRKDSGTFTPACAGAFLVLGLNLSQL